ncbi:phage portal protein [Shewanella xiamenensis]|uniref:phage portal protein n=1 Tax=Shewanella xiamenensis TaxID=332186 RepID=UPI0021C1A84B|nr:phage portal protein [Shewanella xiamenensis]MCT8876653.1 phage portal protein [Shewanella xiamenensis]
MGWIPNFLKSKSNSKNIEKSVSEQNSEFNELMRRIRSGGTSKATLSEMDTLGLSDIFACIKVKSNTVSQLPLKMFDTRKGRTQLSARDNPTVYTLTKRPNNYQTMHEFIKMMIMHLDIRGNFYALITRDSIGNIVDLLPIPPEIRPVIELVDDALVYRIGAVVYDQSEILHIKDFSFDSIRGLNNFDVACNVINLDYFARNHGLSFFMNGSAPAGVITSEKAMSREAQAAFLESWVQTYGGVGNHNRTAMLVDGVDYKSIGTTNVEAQLLETRKFQRSEIAGVFLVPAFMIGDLENAHFNNLESQNRFFHQTCIGPLLQNIEEKINSILPDGMEIEFDDQTFLRGDVKTQADVHKAYLEMGVYSVNEIREEIGKEHIPDGDKRVVQTNNITFGGNGNTAPEKPQNQPPVV